MQLETSGNMLLLCILLFTVIQMSFTSKTIFLTIGFSISCCSLRIILGMFPSTTQKSFAYCFAWVPVNCFGRSTISYFKNIYSTLSYSCTLALFFRDLFWRMSTALISSQNSVLVQSLASGKAADKHNISTTGIWPLKFGLGWLSCFTFIAKSLWHFNGDEPDVQASQWSLFGTRMQSVCGLQLNTGLQASLWVCLTFCCEFFLGSLWVGSYKKKNCQYNHAFGRLVI